MRSDGVGLGDVIGSSIGRLPRDGRLPDAEPPPAELADECLELWGEIPLVCTGYLPLEIQRQLTIRDETTHVTDVTDLKFKKKGES